MPPLRQRFDFILDGQGHMLARDPNSRARAWHRSGAPDTLGKTTVSEDKYNSLPPEIDYAEVWDDWSEGWGHAYRDASNPNTYHWGQNIDARFKGQLVHCQAPRLVPDASINISVDRFLDIPLPGVANQPAGAGGVLTTGRGFIALRCPTGIVGSPFINFYAIGTSERNVGRPAVFGSHIYIGMGVASPFARYDLSDLTATLGPFSAENFCVAGGRLWRLNGGRFLNSVAAEANAMATANWSATLSVGNGNLTVQDMTQLNDQLYLGMADGLYAGDQSGSFYNVLPAQSFAINIDNGRDLEVMDNTILGTYADDIVYLQPNSMEARAGHIGPIGYTGNRSQIFARLRALRSLGPWLYAGAWVGGTASFILAGRQGNQGNYVWHTQQRLPHYARISRMHFDGISTSSGAVELVPRLWIATDNSGFTGTAPLYYLPIPKLNANPLTLDPTFTPNYCGSARIDLGIVDHGAPGTTKIFRSVEVWADNFTPDTVGCHVYYTIDNEASRNFLGCVETSPKGVLYFPSVEGSFLSGQSISLSIDSLTAIATTTPIYRAIILRGALRPRNVETITAKVRIADNMRDRFGQPMPSGAAQIGHLRMLAGSDIKTVQPRQLIDLAGAAVWVNVIPPITEEEYYQHGEDYPEVMATVQMAVLEWSTNPWAGEVAIVNQA